MKAETIKSYDFPYIIEAQKILAADPSRQLTITALALEVGINSFKLRVGFKQLFKTTIHQYRLDLRLNLAKQLLTETDLTISEIAYKDRVRQSGWFCSLLQAQAPRISPRMA